jgi:ADP-ribose pyrophosphatase YjhB (NUDIX family)
MRVKVRAVVLKDGKVVVSRERRQGEEYLLLPGGRVQNGESIAEALVREVAEEVGLDVVPDRLLYVAEVVGSYGVHDVNLVWLAELRNATTAIAADALVPLESPEAASIMPPIMERIAADATNGWDEAPRWLGNIRRPPRTNEARATQRAEK